MLLKYNEAQEKCDSIKVDFRNFSNDVETQNKLKNETIDNLVAEYSRLAAETEIRQNNDTTRYEIFLIYMKFLETYFL